MEKKQKKTPKTNEKKLKKTSESSKKREFSEIEPKVEEKKNENSDQEVEPTSIAEDDEIYMSDDFEFQDEEEEEEKEDFIFESEDSDDEEVKAKTISIVDESKGPKVKNEVTKAPLFKDVENDDDSSEDEVRKKEKI
jgi:hypothetical protein